MTAAARLDAVAKERGWRLRWKSGTLTTFPSLTLTELDVFEGRRLVTVDGSIWSITSRDGTPRETIATMILKTLSRRSAPQPQPSQGGRQC